MSKLILHEPAGQNSHFIETTCWEYVLDRIVCRTLGENYKKPSVYKHMIQDSSRFFFSLRIAR